MQRTLSKRWNLNAGLWWLLIYALVRLPVPRELHAGHGGSGGGGGIGALLPFLSGTTLPLLSCLMQCGMLYFSRI